jgi:tape measure domain-containing protein
MNIKEAKKILADLYDGTGIAMNAGDELAAAQLVHISRRGVVGRDEWCAFVEHSPRVARAIADGWCVSVGEIRRYVSDSALTCDEFIGAIKRCKTYLDRGEG